MEFVPISRDRLELWSYHSPQLCWEA